MLALIFVLIAVSSPAFAQTRPSIDALLSRVADLEAVRGSVRVLANGEPIGSLLDIRDAGLKPGISYLVLSPKRYFFHVQAASAEADFVGDLLGPIVYFTTADCSGQPWISSASTLDGSQDKMSEGLSYGPSFQGIVVQESDNEGWMRHLYVPAGSQSQYKAATGIITGRPPLGQCGEAELSDPAGGVGSDSYFPAVPNDPAVTGVPNERFDGPITIE